MDIKIEETGNGGDMVFKGKDLVAYGGYENLVYLALFGGKDYWGNIFLNKDLGQTYSSETEEVLNSVTLNSSGRLKIEQAVYRDLEFIKKNVPGTVIKVDVSIISDDRVDIGVNINGEQFNMNWNPPGAPVVLAIKKGYYQDGYIQNGYI